MRNGVTRSRRKGTVVFVSDFCPGVFLRDTRTQAVNTYKLTQVPLGLGAQSNRHTSVPFKLKNQYIAIPAFRVNDIPAWPGSSYVAARVGLTLGVVWSIAMPVAAGSNYCLAIYYDGNRYKLTGGVGEVLHYPVYDGRALPATQVMLEFWTINDGETVMSQLATLYLPMTLLTVPVEWNDQSRSIYLTSPTPTPTEIPYS